jgi:Acetyltransferase (GNAT) domain
VARGGRVRYADEDQVLPLAASLMITLLMFSSIRRCMLRLFRNIRHAGVGRGSVPTGLIDLSVVAFNEVVRYDETVFPAPRATFLSRWIRQREGEALGVVGNEGLSGYGVLRACRRGFKIGPLFADDVRRPSLSGPRVARDRAIRLSRYAGSQLRRHRTGHGMTPTFETARMYTREPPKSRLDRCFGVTTFELG